MGNDKGLIARLRKAAEDFEGCGDWHANNEDSDCEPHWSCQGEMQEASKAAIEAADALVAAETAMRQIERRARPDTWREVLSIADDWLSQHGRASPAGNAVKE